MSGRVIGRNAIAVTNPAGGVDSYGPGTPESEIPDDVLATLGDHVWAGNEPVDAGTTGIREFGPEGRVIDPARSLLDQGLGVDQWNDPTDLELAAAGISPDGEPPKAAPETTPEPGTNAPVEFDAEALAAELTELSQSDLRDRADEYGVSKGGSNAEIVDRIVEAAEGRHNAG